MKKKTDYLNYVYIFCDELRTDVLSCYNENTIDTPNIDRIAKNGLLFDQCYCNSPVCVPSRFSILTSQYPEKTGVYHNEAAYPTFHLKKEWETFPEVFAKHGYSTASFGKTHIPNKKNAVFQYNDESGGEMNLGISGEKLTNVLRPEGSFKTILAADYPPKQKYYPEVVTENALNWIGKQDQPFFARISYLQPHTPIIVKKEFVDKLVDVEFSGEITDYETSLFEKCFKDICDIKNMKSEDAKKMRKYYKALVLWLDQEVGKILSYLESKDLIDNTVIVFNADHGASRGENGALAKQTFAPQSHKVPLIISCNGKILPGIKHDICEGIDIGPTLLLLSNIEVPCEFQGIDLLREKKEFSYSTCGYGEVNSFAFPNKRQGKYLNGQGWPRRACIRTNRYRLDMNVKRDGKFIKDDVFFCDIQKYPLEDINLVNNDEYQDIIKQLYDKLCRHINQSVEVDDIKELEFYREKI